MKRKRYPARVHSCTVYILALRETSLKALIPFLVKSQPLYSLIKPKKMWKTVFDCVCIHHARDKSGFFWKPQIHKIKFGPDNSGLQRRERTLFLAPAFQRFGRIKKLGIESKL